MSLNIVEKYKQYVQSFDDMLRLVLYEGEVCRVPDAFKEIKIVSGCAWLSMNGKDILLGQGEKILLTANKGMALISPVRDVPVVLEARKQIPRAV